MEGSTLIICENRPQKFVLKTICMKLKIICIRKQIMCGEICMAYLDNLNYDKEIKERII